MGRTLECTACLLVFVYSFSLYGVVDESLLHGDFVYDDAGSVSGNGIVSMKLPLSDLWHLDYWGTPLSDSSSHKSWRPITTWTFYLNYKYFGSSSYSFHLTNALIHSFTSMLVIPTVLLGIPNSSLWFATMTALLFSSHPVHVESVQNINGRADILGSMFYLLGFVTYAKLVSYQKMNSSWLLILVKSLFVYTLPVMVLTCMGMMSKETSITLPLLCTAWDFAIISKLNIITFIKYQSSENDGNSKYKIRIFHNIFSNMQRKRLFFQWLLRSCLLGLCTVCLAVYRSYKNGGHAIPKLTLNQNRISLQNCDESLKMKIWQILSLFYLWYEYVKTMIFPCALSADWSGRNFPPLYENSNVTELYQRNFQDVPNTLQKNNFNFEPPFSENANGKEFSTSGTHLLTKGFETIQYRGYRYGQGLFDHRLPLTLLFTWACFAFFFESLKQSQVIQYSHVKEKNDPNTSKTDSKVRSGGHHVSFVSFLFLFLPFVLSSNMLVSVGTSKAERLMYLPILGYTVLISYLLSDENKQAVKGQKPSNLLSMMKKCVFVLTLIAYSKRSLVRAKEWDSTLTVWESAYRTGSSNGYVTAHTLQNYGLALQWEGDFESANLIFEEYDMLGDEELDDLKYNIEVYQVLGLRMIGRLNEAKRRTHLIISRLDQMIQLKESQGKDYSGQVNKRSRLYRVLALIVSHESLQGAAHVLANAGGSGDHFTLRCTDDMDKGFSELEALNQELMESNIITQPLLSIPYPFIGYDDLPGNRAILASSLASRFASIRDQGLGHVLLVGGGSGGTLVNLLARA